MSNEQNNQNSDASKKEAAALESEKIEALAIEVLKGKHGIGEARAKSVGPLYEKVADRVRAIRLQNGK